MTPRRLGNFLLRRSVRLDPPYWVAIALACAPVLVRRAMGRSVALPTTPQVAANAFYLQGILGYDDLNVVFWTLCLEFQFYAAFGLLLALLQPLARDRGVLRSRAAWVLLPLYVASLAWPAGALPFAERPVWCLPFWHEFLLGALTWTALDGSLPGPAWGASALALWAIGGWTFAPRPFVAAATATALYVAGRRGALTRWLAGPVFALGGRLSYSLYLVHVPVFLAFAGLRTRVGTLTLGRSLAIGAAAWAAAIGFAWVFHRLVEAPFLAVAARLKPERRPY